MNDTTTPTSEPAPYIKIKENRRIGNVKAVKFDIDKVTSCECYPFTSNTCGLYSDCLNRALLTECNPLVCPAGSACENQSFEKRESPPLAVFKTENRGWGLKTLAALNKGQFIIEYVGDIVNRKEYQRRLKRMEKNKALNYYFVTIDCNRIVDAGPRGNDARFLNHSCMPNCEIQKWIVNNDIRIGIFASVDIPAGTELTAQYNLLSRQSQKCFCGMPNCSGYIGLKHKSKKPRKKQKLAAEKKMKNTVCEVKPKTITKRLCFICSKEGDLGEDLGTCSTCKMNFHLECVPLTAWPDEGNQWECPRHYCNSCMNYTRRICSKCTNSYCRLHSQNNITHQHGKIYYCNNHK